MLFLYKRRGIKSDQQIQVLFADHIKWALQYHDRWFQYHDMFLFLLFGIQWCWQAIGSARLQMRWKNFESDTCTLSSIMKYKLEKAIKEKSKHLPISDPAVRLLLQQVHATGSHVQGSDSSCAQWRTQICSTSIAKGSATVWATINSMDLQSIP